MSLFSSQLALRKQQNRPISTCYDSDVSSHSGIPAKNYAAIANPNGQRTPLKTVFLDRDGIINRKLPEGEYASSWERFTLLPGVFEAIARLNRAGLRVVVVTNQRGIALGKYTVSDVESIHRKLQLTLAPSGAHIDGFYFCPHDKAECNCRKPILDRQCSSI